MKIEDVILYHKKYKGNKIAFNSRKGVGRVVEGIVVDIDRSLNAVILTDYDNFPHCVLVMTLKEI